MSICLRGQLLDKATVRMIMTVVGFMTGLNVSE